MENEIGCAQAERSRMGKVYVSGFLANERTPENKAVLSELFSMFHPFDISIHNNRNYIVYVGYCSEFDYAEVDCDTPTYRAIITNTSGGPIVRFEKLESCKQGGPIEFESE